MKKKEKKKILRRKIGLLFIRFFTFVSGKLPLSVNFFLGRIFGNLVYVILSTHRRVAFESLSIAFPDYTKKEKEKIVKSFFRSMVEGGFELLYYLSNTAEIKEAVEIKGKDNLDRALAGGKGVIIVTAHYGNFPLMSLRLAAEGYSVNIVARPMRDKYAEGHFHKLRSNAKVKTISAYPRRACVSGIIKALADNQIVIIQMDQNFGTGGVWVDFFGKLAATPTGPIVLSLRSKAAIITSCIYQSKGRKHLIEIFPEGKLTFAKTKEETILVNAAKLTKIIESWIKMRPNHWSWIHRRWKSQPGEKTKKERVLKS